MKANRMMPLRFLIVLGIFPLAADLWAAPLGWFRGPPLLSPNSGAAASVLGDGSNLLIGGDGFYFPESLAATNSAWAYVAAGFYSKAPIGMGISGGGDPLLAFGGTDGTTATNGVIWYSPSGDVVTAAPQMNYARAYLGYADAGGNTYAIGGLDQNNNALATAETISQDGGTAWSLITGLPAPRYDFPAVSDQADLIYIFGGRTNAILGGEIASVLKYSVSANTWTAAASMPVPTAGSSAAMGVDGKIYVVGGVSGGVTTNLVQVYTPGSNSWVISTSLPEALTASAMAVDTQGRLIVIGGRNGAGTDVPDVWRSQLLGTPDSAPAFVSYPATSAAYNVQYASSINATGNPQPVYVVVNGPTGLQVDIYSGAITWTPQANQIGTNPVTVMASNYVGSVNWSFDIVVPWVKPSAPTNVTLVSVNDNSATLSWDPESSVVGPVTYSVAIPHGIRYGYVYQTVATNLTATTFTMQGLTPGSSTTFAVNARGPSGTSPYSSWVYAHTTAPQGPTNLLVTSVTPTTVGLAWSPSAGPSQNPSYSAITSYSIMEHIFTPASNVPVVTNLTSTTGTVTGLTPGSAHLWFVSGVDAQGYASPLGSIYVVVTNPTNAAPLLTGGAVLTNGNFQFTVQENGGAPQTVYIQANNDLTKPTGWIQIGSVLPASTNFIFTDTNSGIYTSRFYRILAP